MALKSQARWWWRAAGMLGFLLLLLALIVRTERSGRLTAADELLSEARTLSSALDLNRLSLQSTNGMTVAPGGDDEFGLESMLERPVGAHAERIELGAASSAQVELSETGNSLLVKLIVDAPRRGAGGSAYRDELKLGLDTPVGNFRYALKASNAFEIEGVAEAGTYSLSFAPSVSGLYQESSSGYWMVLELAPKSDVRALGFSLREDGHALALRPVLRAPDEINQALSRLASARTRLALLNSSGAVLSYAAAPDYREPADPGLFVRLACFLSGGLEPRGWWIADAEPFSSAAPPQLTREAPEVRWSAPAGRGCQRRLEVLAPLDSAALNLWMGREYAVTPGLQDGIEKALSRTGLSLALLALVGLYGWIEFKRARLRVLTGAVSGNGVAQLKSAEQRLVFLLPDEIGDLAHSIAALKRDVADYTGYLNSLAGKLSHELNTPLAVVRSSLDNLESSELPDESRIYAERARQGADRLSGILRAMGEASRIERAIESAESEEFDLCALLLNLHAVYSELASPRELRLSLPDEACMVSGAPDLIAQALDKLIDNALSFTPLAGFIGLEVKALKRGFELSVSNSGPPLKEDMRAKLFDSLVSLRQGKAQAPHLGLGLYIVRLIATLHQGQAQAENLPDGAGVRFSISIIGMPRRR